MTLYRKIITLVLAIACVGFIPVPLDAQEYLALSKGQTVYVPAYSHIYIGGKKRPFLCLINNRFVPVGREKTRSPSHGRIRHTDFLFMHGLCVAFTQYQ